MVDDRNDPSKPCPKTFFIWYKRKSVRSKREKRDRKTGEIFDGNMFLLIQTRISLSYLFFSLSLFPLLSLSLLGSVILKYVDHSLLYLLFSYFSSNHHFCPVWPKSFPDPHIRKRRKYSWTPHLNRSHGLLTSVVDWACCEHKKHTAQCRLVADMTWAI